MVKTAEMVKVSFTLPKDRDSGRNGVGRDGGEPEKELVKMVNTAEKNGGYSGNVTEWR